MRKYLVIDCGTSKTAALLFGEHRQKIVNAAEYVCGSNQIVTKNNFNFAVWQSVLTQILDYFKQGHNLKNVLVILTLPGSLLTFCRETIDQKKFKPEKIWKELQKNEQALLLPPLLNSTLNLPTEIFWPKLKRDIFIQLDKYFQDKNLKLSQIYYGLPFYQQHLDAANYALINLGGRSIDVLIYQNNNLQKINILPIGGEQVVRDIAVVLQVSEDEARQKLFEFKNLFDSFINKGEETLTGVIDERVREIFRLIKNSINLPVDRLYLCGGLANCSKLPEFLQNYLQLKTVNLNEKITRNSFLFEQAYLTAEYFLARNK